MIGGIVGVCEGGGGNGTIGWAAVAVAVWLKQLCTSEMIIVDRVTFTFSSKTYTLGRVYPLIQPDALLSYWIAFCWYRENYWYWPLSYILASGIKVPLAYGQENK